MKAYLELSDSLDSTDLEQILILAYLGDEVVLLEKNASLTLPAARFEREEAIEKTVRRALYEQTGAFLGSSKLLGLLRIERRKEEQQIPIYVGLIRHLESPVLQNVGRKRFCSTEEAKKYLIQPEWKHVKDFLFHHAWKMKMQLQ